MRVSNQGWAKSVAQTSVSVFLTLFAHLNIRLSLPTVSNPLHISFEIFQLVIFARSGGNEVNTITR